MDMKNFFESTDPDILQKIAEDSQNELLEKMLPILEKTANYTAYLVMQKLAEAMEDGVSVDPVMPPPATQTPATGNRSNADSRPNPIQGGLDMKQVHDAVAEALATQNASKIIPFVQAVGGKHPEVLNEIIKAVKVELHDAIMKQLIDEESAVQISQALNGMVEA